MRRIFIVPNYAHTILLYCYYTIFMSLYLYNYTYTCMFVSTLSDPTSNSERSANGGNKQILCCIVLYCIVLYVSKTSLLQLSATNSTTVTRSFQTPSTRNTREINNTTFWQRRPKMLWFIALSCCCCLHAWKMLIYRGPALVMEEVPMLRKRRQNSSQKIHISRAPDIIP